MVGMVAVLVSTVAAAGTEEVIHFAFGHRFHLHCIHSEQKIAHLMMLFQPLLSIEIALAKI